MSPTPLLSVQQLSLEVAKRSLIENLSFDVNPGDFVIVRGPNGSGKSTLLRALSGAEPIADGVVRCSVPPEFITLLPQSQNLAFDLLMTKADLLSLEIKGVKVSRFVAKNARAARRVYVIR